MQMKNNYQKNVFNGDIGFVARIADGKMWVSYPDLDVTYERKELDELALAYAMSVHKSQGSEYPIVILPLTAGHHVMLQRNLLYTAVTRAKRQVILLGTKAALCTAVENDRMRKRYTLLAERLNDTVVLE
jgi:exodeoxyribonuclease V alpha subunit